jgi:hypothetical protein
MKRIIALIIVYITCMTATAQNQKAAQGNKSGTTTRSNAKSTSAPLDSATKLRIRSYDMKYLPHYPGGDMAMFTFIAKYLKYTQADKDKKTNGNVLIRFDVDADSTVKEIRLLIDPCIDCGKDLVKLFESMKFVPALTKAGTQMRSNMMLEVPVWAH